MLDAGDSGDVWAVAFHQDGKHLLGGTRDGIRRWQLADSQEVERQKKDILTYAIAVSRDQRWIVCGTEEGASVWDEETHEKVIDVEGTSTVYAVDVSPDSTRFATGITEAGSIWSITSGKRLVGPLIGHVGVVGGVRFSPNDEHIAIVGSSDICIFDSHTGNKLVTINNIDISYWVGTPIAWSSDGQQIFAASNDNTINSFDVSTGSQVAESQVLHDGATEVPSLALAANGKFIATFAWHSITFLDTSTLAQIGPVIEDSEQIRSIAISSNSSQLATGQGNGKIAIRDLSGILPDSWSVPCESS